MPNIFFDPLFQKHHMHSGKNQMACYMTPYDQIRVLAIAISTSETCPIGKGASCSWSCCDTTLGFELLGLVLVAALSLAAWSTEEPSPEKVFLCTLWFQAKCYEAKLLQKDDLSMFIHSYVASLPCAKKLQKCCKGVVAPLRLALTAQPSAMGNQGHTWSARQVWWVQKM